MGLLNGLEHFCRRICRVFMHADLVECFMNIRVGTLAVAKRGSGVCKEGEVGVCYEVYTLGDRPSYSFIFERGRFDGFSPRDVELFLEPLEVVVPLGGGLRVSERRTPSP